MSSYSLNNDELYDLAAELGYFNADIAKKDENEKNRVWNEAHTYCQKNGTPIDVFFLWLRNRVTPVNSPRSKGLIERIKTTDKEEKPYTSYNNDTWYEPNTAEIKAWKRKHPGTCIYPSNDDDLYNLVAELGYFKADVSKNNSEERKRVRTDVLSFCRKNQMRFDNFVGFLKSRVSSEKPASKTLSKFPTVVTVVIGCNSDNDRPTYCEEFNDDWDGPKY